MSKLISIWTPFQSSLLIFILEILSLWWFIILFNYSMLQSFCHVLKIWLSLDIEKTSFCQMIHQKIWKIHCYLNLMANLSFSYFTLLFLVKINPLEDYQIWHEKKFETVWQSNFSLIIPFVIKMWKNQWDWKNM